MLSNQADAIASNVGVKRARTDEPIINVERDHFAQFVANRNWRFSEGFWSRLIHGSAHCLPDYVIGDTEGIISKDRFGVTSLNEIHEAGKKGEFVSKNFRYFSKQTFALRVGYDGNKYHGYQMQKYCPGLTVESDLKEALGCNTIGAGRTDRGVSGVSQVICFNHNDMTRTPDYYLEKFRASKPFLEGRLAVYDCQRVPKKFHARASATWRRYLYMFPLNRVDEHAVELDEVRGVYRPVSKPDASSAAKYDVDIEFLNLLFSKLENVDLPYNAYAFKLDRVAGNGMQDKCILYKARASVVNLADAVPGTTWGPVPTPIALDPSLVRVYKKEDKQEEKSAQEGETAEGAVESVIVDTAVDETSTIPSENPSENSAVMDVADQSTPSTEQSPPAPQLQQQQQRKKKNTSSDEHDHDDEVEDAADSYLTSGSTGAVGAAGVELGRGMDPTVSVEVPEGSEVPAMCIELVGNRFLRRMVRILTATAIREATKDPSERNENLLVEICNSGDRERAARSLPGPPLCLAGVGYDAFDLSLYKFQPKTEVNARIAERDRDLAK